MNKLITIVVPVYNVEKYIERCIVSLYSSDESLFNLVLVDDETPDNSISVAEHCLRGYSNFRIVHQKNKGLSGARNTGLAIVETPYIWFVDSDDFLLENAIGRVLKVIKEYGSHVDIIHFGFEYMYANTIRKSRIAFENQIVAGYELLRKIGGEVSAWRNVYKVSFLRENHLSFYDGLLFEDLDFNVKAFSLTESIYVMNEYLYEYNQVNSDSIMHNVKVKHAESMLIIVRDISNFIKDRKMNKEKISVCCYHAGRAFTFSLRYYNKLVPNEKSVIEEVYRQEKNDVVFALRNSYYLPHKLFSFLLIFLSYPKMSTMIDRISKIQAWL